MAQGFLSIMHILKSCTYSESVSCINQLFVFCLRLYLFIILFFSLIGIPTQCRLLRAWDTGHYTITASGIVTTERFLYLGKTEKPQLDFYLQFEIENNWFLSGIYSLCISVKILSQNHIPRISKPLGLSTNTRLVRLEGILSSNNKLVVRK